VLVRVLHQNESPCSGTVFLRSGLVELLRAACALAVNNPAQSKERLALDGAGCLPCKLSCLFLSLK